MLRFHRLWSAALMTLALVARSSIAAEANGPAPFGAAADGSPVHAYVLDNGAVRVRLVTLGAAIQSVEFPDRAGKTADVVLGFDDAAGYQSDRNQYFGTTTGRVCNRIADGKFTLDGKTYELAVNNGPNHLHGGVKRSFDKVVWEAEKTKTDHGPAVRFTYTSPDGEEGYPGRLATTVVYSLAPDGSLWIEFTAETDKPTPVNITNHSYFNLAGAGSPTVLDHLLTIEAEQYTPMNDASIPTGKIDDVSGTPVDFTRPTRIGDRIEKLIPTASLGYDHNFVLRPRKAEPTLAAKLHDPASGRTLTVLTTQPGVQFYTGNYLKDQEGKKGKTYPQRSALCLETQHFPDSVNQPSFPTTIVKPGVAYRHTCVYQFTTE
ncbi:MAG: aldose epimerase family protein [Planctomycetia bacterium]